MVTPRKINDYLEGCGVSHANMGFLYLQTGIDMLITGEASRASVISLYRSVAEKHGSTAPQVERAMRVSVKSSSYGASAKTREFLTRAADILKLEDGETQPSASSSP